jgi:hypothetical protein
MARAKTTFFSWRFVAGCIEYPRPSRRYCHGGPENRKPHLGWPRSGSRAVDKVVAQISKSAVSQVSNLRGASKFRPPADLEIGDTAGLEACATCR